MLNHLFTPLIIKSVTIPNRLVVAPMVTNYCNGDGTATERYIAYHEEKAKGGWGLIITEDYAISPQGKGFTNVAGLWDDSQIAGHSELTRRVHRHGSKIFAQVYHAGRQTSSPVIGETPVAPSAVPDPFSIEVPRELTVAEIEAIIQQFGDCALRCKKCGFDGIQLHGAHGYLLSEFMSPYANKRTDRYGGPLENRLRFALEVIADVREKCGPDFIIDYRISGDEFVPGGRAIEDTKTIVPYLVKAGIDTVHVSCGVYASATVFVAPQIKEHGMITDFAKEVKQVVDIPVTTVLRINDPRIAEQILVSGKADLVAMARPSLTDPALPNKAKAGRFGDIRQCIACNYGCLGYLFVNKAVHCVLNPTVGKEYLQPKEPAKTKKNIAVIGGGPAGMQAAISAAGRGHSVTLFEKSGVLGGQFRLAAVPPAKGELAAFTNWQENQLGQLGVTVKMNTPATTENIGKPDAVILATGAVPIKPLIPGADGPNVVQVNDLLEGKAFPGMKVAVIGGGQSGAETADYLGIIGRQVTLIEMSDDIATQVAMAPRRFLMESLEENHVQILTDTKVAKITSTGVETECGKTIACDTVVLALGVSSENSLAAQLESAGHKVVLIGDAKEPRNVMDAIMEGHEAAIAM